MILLRLRTTTWVTSCSFWMSLTPSLLSTYDGSASEAKLQTATSSGAQYSTISVHRLELRMVPRFFWLLLRLQWSLYSMKGVPVSVCASRMAYQSFWALTVLRPLPTHTNNTNRTTNTTPKQTTKPKHSLG